MSDILAGSVGGTPEVLWRPDPGRVAASQIARFRDWLRERRQLDVVDYESLWRWSVTDIEGFWSALAEYLQVRFHQPWEQVLDERRVPGARWFPGSTLNYAEHALSSGPGKADEDLAVLFHREDGLREQISFGELRRRVASARAGFVELGVRRGDRVVALAPNAPATLVAFLAAASLGATWSSCSPDFGAHAIADRFTQIEPTVLVAVDGYTYRGRRVDVRPTAEALRACIPSLRATVLVDYLGTGGTLPNQPHPVVGWADMLDRHRDAELVFDPVPFDHPLWILYSSGTTGLPKGIVHGHGGIVVEHLKSLALHTDLRPADRFFWFTTTGWMMWNLLVSGLLVGSTVVLFDGCPTHPDHSALWRLAEQLRITHFGTSAPYIHSCLKQELRPGERFDLSALRMVGSTGAPLSPEGFRWVVEAVSPEVQVASISGGTDLCTALVGAAPDVPVWLGEISCRMLGASVVAYDEQGTEISDEVGELVVTEPMPSMPVSFWNDPDGRRLHEAYFDTYQGMWRHGDWIRVTPRGSCVISGRSDSTLNRGGVRMGTSEFYRVVEGFDEVLDSLVIDTSGDGRIEGTLLCFLVLADGAQLAELEPILRAELRAALSPRYVPDLFFAVADIPRTLNGKKCEVPVKKILAGASPERAVSRDALSNPEALAPFLEMATRMSGGGTR